MSNDFKLSKKAIKEFKFNQIKSDLLKKLTTIAENPISFHTKISDAKSKKELIDIIKKEFLTN